jgi:hypothetical protein
MGLQIVMRNYSQILISFPDVIESSGEGVGGPSHLLAKNAAEQNTAVNTNLRILFFTTYYLLYSVNFRSFAANFLANASFIPFESLLLLLLCKYVSK